MNIAHFAYSSADGHLVKIYTVYSQCYPRIPCWGHYLLKKKKKSAHNSVWNQYNTMCAGKKRPWYSKCPLVGKRWKLRNVKDNYVVTKKSKPEPLEETANLEWVCEKKYKDTHEILNIIWGRQECRDDCFKHTPLGNNAVTLQIKVN